MFKLIKYEFLKKQKFLLATLGVLVFMELGILFGIYKGNQWSALSFFLSFIMISGVILLVFIDTIRSYSFDLNNKQGYSLFLTPVSGYKIIGSKAIVSLLELIFGVFVVSLLMYLNFLFLKFLYFDSLNEILIEIINGIKSAKILPSLGQIALFISASSLQWFNTIMIAIFAITLRKTILSQSKFGWLISLILFIAVYSLIETINVGVLSSFGFVRDTIELTTVSEARYISGYITKYVSITAISYPIYIGTLYFLSGLFLNKRVDL